MTPDTIDLKILDELQRDGRITNVELGARVGLTPGPTQARVHKLEEAGWIQGYGAQLNREALGLPITAYASVILKEHGKAFGQAFIEAVRQIPEVLEVHHIAGEEDYLLKVLARSPKHYESILLEKLTAIDSVQRIKTTFVLSSPKVSTIIPIQNAAESLGGPV